MENQEFLSTSQYSLYSLSSQYVVVENQEFFIAFQYSLSSQYVVVENQVFFNASQYSSPVMSTLRNTQNYAISFSTYDAGTPTILHYISFRGATRVFIPKRNRV